MKRLIVVISLLAMGGCVSTLSCGVDGDSSWVEITGTGSSSRVIKSICGFNTTE